MIRAAGLVPIVVALVFPSVAPADECGDAVRDYNTTMTRLEDAMQKFSACTANSLGRDGCAAEFRKLRSVFGEYEAAVAVYKKQCI